MSTLSELSPQWLETSPREEDNPSKGGGGATTVKATRKAKPHKLRMASSLILSTAILSENSLRAGLTFVHEMKVCFAR